MSQEIIKYEAPGQPIVVDAQVTVSPVQQMRLRPTLPALVVEFVAYHTPDPELRKLTQKNETANAYTRILHDFIASLGDDQAELVMFPATLAGEDALTAAIQRFLPTSKAGRSVAIATRNQRLACLKSFYKWCQIRKYTTSRYLEELKPLRGNTSPHAAGPLPADQVATGLNQIDTSSLTGKRDKALLVMLLITSRRVSEVRLLRWSEIREQSGTWVVTFVEKGGDVHRTPLDQATSKILQDYRRALEKRYRQLGQCLNDQEYVFVGLGNRSFARPLSIVWISRLCKEYLGDSRIHVTRHTWAVEATKAGADANDVRKQLGHASLAHTIKYLEEKTAIVNPFATALAEKWGLSDQ